MSSRIIIMFVIGFGLMFAMWAMEWRHQEEETLKNTPIRGCAQEDNCGGETPVCLVHAEIPLGVCTSNCVRTSECPELWCCTRLKDQSGPLRCLPPELCEGP